MSHQSIEFRAWDKVERDFVYFALYGGVNRHTPDIYAHAELEPWEQRIGPIDISRNESIFLWEGDIVLTKDGDLAIVEYQEESALFSLHIYGGRPLYQCEIQKVVGNIHQNKDLIPNLEEYLGRAD